MALELANYKEQARDAIKAFWGNREAAQRKQAETGNIDAGTRGAVTAGKNLDGFVALIQSLVKANGLAHAQIHVNLLLVSNFGCTRHPKHTRQHQRSATHNPHIERLAQNQHAHQERGHGANHAGLCRQA